ncbi:hypothetical protein GCM10025867_39800 [Frondihabitans sucicola]|uniref:Uncharacterized protein n=1 Tax=Frondihabitans sucicola TaxID=1268041 RepID=A0ABN6Y358_9MICO|nr:hypothetical protein GCM10025867_39800 [Frondihabitans sucicola]
MGSIGVAGTYEPFARPMLAVLDLVREASVRVRGEECLVGFAHVPMMSLSTPKRVANTFGLK